MNLKLCYVVSLTLTLGRIQISDLVKRLVNVWNPNLGELLDYVNQRLYKNELSDLFEHLFCCFLKPLMPFLFIL